MALAVKISYVPRCTLGVVADDSQRVAHVLAPGFGLGLIEPSVPGGLIKELSGVAWADVKEAAGVAEASIKKVSGVTAN